MLCPLPASYAEGHEHAPATGTNYYYFFSCSKVRGIEILGKEVLIIHTQKSHRVRGGEKAKCELSEEHRGKERVVCAHGRVTEPWVLLGSRE